jgi:hypothetical protein
VAAVGASVNHELLIGMFAAFAALLLILLFYSSIAIQATLSEILGELIALRCAYEADAYEEEDDAPGMIERLHDWLVEQELSRQVDEVIARAHLVEQELGQQVDEVIARAHLFEDEYERTDGGASWGRVE